MRGLTPALAMLLTVAGCSAGGGGAYDGGVRDAVYEVSLDLPPGCPPATPNELGIGKSCTMGGKQCAYPLLCTCDAFVGVQLVGVPCICTLAGFASVTPPSTDPCKDSVPASFCGGNATCCNYMTAAAYCVPSICLPDNQCPVFEPPMP
jgi:hypothetical protein